MNIIKALIGLLTLWLMTLWATNSWGQTVLAVNLDTAKFTWTFTQGTGGVVKEFRIKCGAATKTYTIVFKPIAPTAREQLIKPVITGSGKYFCVVVANNDGGDSPPSNEVSFTTDTPPAAPTNLQITGDTAP